MNMQFLKRLQDLEVLVSVKSFTCEAQVPLRAGSKRPTCTGGSFLLSTQVLPGAAENVINRQTLILSMTPLSFPKVCPVGKVSIKLPVDG